MKHERRFAILITHIGPREGLVEMPWLETEYRVDESDWMVLSDDGWRAVAEGDPVILNAMERKLLVSFYLSQPELIAVIGRTIDGDGPNEIQRRKQQLHRIVARIRSLLLPAGVLGIWTGEDGALQQIVGPADAAHDEGLLLQPVH